MISVNSRTHEKRSLLAPLFIFLIGTGIVIYCFFQFENSTMNPETKVQRLVYAQKELKYFTLGYDDLMADSLWIRYLQDSSVCETSDFNIKVLGAPDNKPALPEGVAASRCHLSWAYSHIDLITDLDEKFLMPYRVGGTLLSVAVDDKEGARRIFEKGISRYQWDWPLMYRAAYHYLYEFGDNQRAADLLMQASQNGGPSWLPLLASRLYSKTGQAMLGISVLEEFIKVAKDEKSKQRAISRLKVLKAELNNAQKNEKPAGE